MSDLAQYFAPQGALASLLKGYQPREGQQQLAEAVFCAVDEDEVLLAEAGTGIGKTFAYLLPLLLSGRKALVSTATKNLQEQIFQQDLPFVKKVLGSPAKMALLKGRRNYFCHYRYTQLQSLAPRSRDEAVYRKRIEDFIDKTLDGDLAALEVPEDAPIIQYITSTADNCLGRNCEFFEECFVQRARQKAKEADLVVVNHHLLLADFALKADGFAEILPDIEAFVIDEAHHLPQTAVNFLGERVAFRAVKTLLDDIDDEIKTDAPDAQDVLAAVLAVRTALAAAASSIAGGGLIAQNAVYDAAALAEMPEFWQALRKLAGALQNLQRELAQHIERGRGIARCAERLEAQLKIVKLFENIEKNSEENSENAVWLTAEPSSFTLNIVPVNAAGHFYSWIVKSEAGWVFLSATLAVNGSFDHFRRELGLPSTVRTVEFASPFDYRRQALLIHPKGMPMPSHPSYTQTLMQKVIPILQRTGGRAFLLFTSYRALREAEEYLNQYADFTLFVQGGGRHKNQLLMDFRNSERGVLLGTSSFWEGVDVRGGKLVCVVIDKLPFAVPTDPLTKARHRLLKEKNLEPFIHDTLPQAVIALKQGVGRLIRDAADYGVLVIGDPRLVNSSYGNIFLNSLPRMTRHHDIAIVDRLFNTHEPDRRS